MQKIIVSIALSLSLFPTASFAKLSTTDTPTTNLVRTSQTASNQILLKNCIIGGLAQHMSRSKSLGNREVFSSVVADCESKYGFKLLSSSTKELKDLTTPTLDASKIKASNQAEAAQSNLMSCMVGYVSEHKEQKLGTDPYGFALLRKAQTACEKMHGAKLTESAAAELSNADDAGNGISQ